MANQARISPIKTFLISRTHPHKTNTYTEFVYEDLVEGTKFRYIFKNLSIRYFEKNRNILKSEEK